MPPVNNPIVVNLQVNITQFRTLGGVFPTSATYTVSSPSPNVKVMGGNIIIKGTSPTQLVFRLPNPGFVFVGATFCAPGVPGDVGTTEFPQVIIDRTPAVNTLTITDVNAPENLNKPYNYILLLQDVQMGNIGFIDPIIISEPP